ncbi:MAG: ASCH domain-containing protein [Anaerolineae bacterium]
MMAVLRALSIQQPYAEQILRGTKRHEFRDGRTHIRERVYIYASETPGPDYEFSRMNLQPGDLPTGVLVGTVEITDCTPGGPRQFRWHLARPERLPQNLKPEKRPSRIWFYPFGKEGVS